MPSVRCRAIALGGSLPRIVAPSRTSPATLERYPRRRERYSVNVVSVIDLIALDLDGTLLDAQGEISVRNRAAINAALQAGIRVVLVTGRGVDLPARLVRELHLNLPSICAHGALTKDFLSGRTLGHIPVPMVYARPMIEFAERNRLNIAVYVEERFYRIEGTHVCMEDMKGAHWSALPSLLGAIPMPPTFLRFLGREAVDAMRAEFSELPLHFKYEVWEDFEECAVTSLEATKKNALERLCADLEIPASRVLAIGDSRNDVPMLRWAGIGVAMGNALADVRQAVGRVTAPYYEDGVALAIERYALHLPGAAFGEEKSA
jgi:5-amino-6-(5-phospho-D-ribitylamino)uracil phosphatase